MTVNKLRPSTFRFSITLPPTNLSLVDLQRFADQVHVQGYHLRSDCGMVLRTQSIFQIKDE